MPPARASTEVKEPQQVIGTSSVERSEDQPNAANIRGACSNWQASASGTGGRSARSSMDSPTLRAKGTGNALRLAKAGLRDELGRLLRLPPSRIPIVGPPGSVAALSTPDAEPGYRAMFESHHEFRNEILARIALCVSIYRPGRRASRGRCRSVLLGRSGVHRRGLVGLLRGRQQVV